MLRMWFRYYGVGDWAEADWPAAPSDSTNSATGDGSTWSERKVTITRRGGSRAAVLECLSVAKVSTAIELPGGEPSRRLHREPSHRHGPHVPSLKDAFTLVKLPKASTDYDKRGY